MTSLLFTTQTPSPHAIPLSDGSGHIDPGWLAGSPFVTSITGTPNQVLTNGTAGIPETGVVVLSTPQDIAPTSSPQFADLSLTGRIIEYKGLSTVGFGVPAIVAYGRAAGLTTADPVLSHFNVLAAGSFQVSANVLVTASTTHNFTMVCNYTDEGGTPRTMTMGFSEPSGTLQTNILDTGGAIPYASFPLSIRAKAGATIIIGTVGTFTSVTYNAEAFIVQLAA